MTSSTAAHQILVERERQLWEEEWTAAHDDSYIQGELVRAANCYSSHAITCTYNSDSPNDYRNAPPPAQWPWGRLFWKPKSPERDLVRAGALLAAEIDRQHRATLRAMECHQDPEA